MNSDNPSSAEARRHETATVPAGNADQPAPPTVDSPPPLSPGALRSTPPEPATMPEVRSDVQHSEVFELAGYEILGEIARGGMGVVYKARQRSLDRLVALKCLPPSFRDDPDRLARFQVEATAAAKLTKHGIVPVYDVLEAGGSPVLVMPYIEGSDLARILIDRIAVRREPAAAAGRHPWATLPEQEFLARVLGLLDRIIDALMCLHQADVLHRDIKPSNILVDLQGDGWLTDFGLARFGSQPGADWAEQTVGTPGYMSPEQWDSKDDLDGRADVFSLGVTAYQAVALEQPFGRKRLKPSTPAPLPPSRHNPLLPDRLDTVISKSLHPDRAQRFQSAAEFKEAWEHARRAPSPPEAVSWWRRAGRWWRNAGHGQRAASIAAVVALCLLVGGGAARLLSLWTEPEPKPVTVPVLVKTEPPGARVVFVPLHPDTGEPEVERAVRPPDEARTPLRIDLAPGLYFVEAETADKQFHQVYRQVPEIGQPVAGLFRHGFWERHEDGTVELPPIPIPTAEKIAGMVACEGAKEFRMGSDQMPEAPVQVVSVKPFLLDVHEVTEGEYRATMDDRLPHQLKEPRGDDHAITHVSYDQALHCAEMMGKRLPTEAEYEWAATLGGTRSFPWGDDAGRIDGWAFRAVGQPAFDRTETRPPILGLFSNVAEWTTSWHPPLVNMVPPPDYRSMRIVRGGPMSVVEANPKKVEYLRGPRFRHAISAERDYPGLGFRCARSQRPLFLNR